MATTTFVINYDSTKIVSVAGSTPKAHAVKNQDEIDRLFALLVEHAKTKPIARPVKDGNPLPAGVVRRITVRLDESNSKVSIAFNSPADGKKRVALSADNINVLLKQLETFFNLEEEDDPDEIDIKAVGKGWMDSLNGGFKKIIDRIGANKKVSTPLWVIFFILFTVLCLVPSCLWLFGLHR